LLAVIVAGASVIIPFVVGPTHRVSTLTTIVIGSVAGVFTLVLGAYYSFASNADDSKIPPSRLHQEILLGEVTRIEAEAESMEAEARRIRARLALIDETLSHVETVDEETL
jgi:hypothetical protein